MIIDRETFTDIAKHLEAASEGLLSAATSVAGLCPDIDPGEPTSLKWLALIESMVAVNGEVTALESVEFRRAWLYAEFLGHDSPSFSSVSFVHWINCLEWPPGHVAKLKHHKSVSRGADRPDDDLDPRQRDAKLIA